MDDYYIYIGDLRDADDLIGIDPDDNPFSVMGLPGKPEKAGLDLTENSSSANMMDRFPKLSANYTFAAITL